MLLAAGCTSGPDVIVVDERLAEGSDEAQRVDFVLEMTNPGDEAIELREMRYDVQLGGRHVFSGRRAAQATLQPGERFEVIMPAVISLSELPGSEASPYHISGSITYITPGVVARMLRDLGLPRPSVGFTHQGQADWQPR